MSQFGIFGDDLGEYGDAALDSGGNLSTSTSVDPMQTSVGPAIDQLILQQPLVQGSQQTVFQNAAKPSVFRAAVPWLLGGLAIAAVAAVVVYAGKEKAKKNEDGGDDGDEGGEGDDDEPPAPNFRRLAPRSKTKRAPAKSSAGAPKKCPVGTEVQTLIFSAAKFDEKEAVSWARKHRFSASKVDETGQSYRIRQHAPSKYKSGSFRTITLATGIKAVIGCPRKKAK